MKLPVNNTEPFHTTPMCYDFIQDSLRFSCRAEYRLFFINFYTAFNKLLQVTKLISGANNNM